MSYRQPETGPTTRFPPVAPEDYGLAPRYEYSTGAVRDISWQSVAIIIAGAMLLISMAKSSAYSEYRAQPPAAEPPPPAITVIDNSWNMCGICSSAR